MVRPDYRDFSSHDRGIMHYGIKRRSGRYPWGSGDRPYQGLSSSISNIFSRMKNGARIIDAKISGTYGTDKYKEEDGPYESLSQLEKKPKDKDYIIYAGKTETESDCVFVNYYGSFKDDGRNKNCLYCSAAMVMRQKGYDVVSRRTDFGEQSNEFMDEYFPGAEPIGVGNKEDITEEELEEEIEEFIDQQENGSYGIMCIKWVDGLSGHAVFYKIENGNINIYDGQSSKYGTIADYINSENVKKSSFIFYPLNNVEPSEKIGHAVVSRDK